MTFCQKWSDTSTPVSLLTQDGRGRSHWMIFHEIPKTPCLQITVRLPIILSIMFHYVMVVGSSFRIYPASLFRIWDIFTGYILATDSPGDKQ